MELGNYLKTLNDASQSQDPTEMIGAMQKFFSEIYKITSHSRGYQLLGLY